MSVLYPMSVMGRSKTNDYVIPPSWISEMVVVTLPSSLIETRRPRFYTAGPLFVPHCCDFDLGRDARARSEREHPDQDQDLFSILPSDIIVTCDVMGGQSPVCHETTINEKNRNMFYTLHAHD